MWVRAPRRAGPAGRGGAGRRRAVPRGPFSQMHYRRRRPGQSGLSSPPPAHPVHCHSCRNLPRSFPPVIAARPPPGDEGEGGGGASSPLPNLNQGSRPPLGRRPAAVRRACRSLGLCLLLGLRLGNRTTMAAMAPCNEGPTPAGAGKARVRERVVEQEQGSGLEKRSTVYLAPPPLLVVVHTVLDLSQCRTLSV